jgi:DNA adenine methylase
MGFNGLCRFNQEGLFNTPFGEYTSTIQMPYWPAYQALLAQWSFYAGSYEKLPIGETDFIFCDPPYENGWQGYYETNFTLDQQNQVAQWLKNHQGPGMIMNHATPEILEIYKDAGFECHIVFAPRSVSAKASSRKNVQEVIATHHFSWKDRHRSV